MSAVAGRPAGDLPGLGGVKEANVLAQQGVKQPGANAKVEACHAQGEQATPHPREHSTPKGHPHQLESGLLKHLPVWLYGCIIDDFASEVGDQCLSQCCCSACDAAA